MITKNNTSHDICVYLKTISSSLLFFCQVPARAEEITIPADVTPEHVPTCIVDYSGTK